MIENLSPGGGGGGLESVVAGTGISVDATNPDNPIITNTSLNTDETAKVSSNDTTAGYLNGKLVAGTNVTFTENNDGGNETLTITATDTNDAAKVSSNDTTAGYLNGKLVAGSGISFTEGNDGGNETLTIANISAGDTTYVVTVNDIENTTSAFDVWSFTVPANTWADGEFISVNSYIQILNNTGLNRTLTVKFTINGSTLGSSYNNSVTQNGTIIAHHYTTHLFQRRGSDISYLAQSQNANYLYRLQNKFELGNTVEPSLSAATFTSDITLTLNFQFGTASPDLYARVFNVRASKQSGQYS